MSDPSFPLKPIEAAPLQDGDTPVFSPISGVTTGPIPGKNFGEYLTAGQLSEKYGVSRATIREWSLQRWFPTPYKVGDRLRWSPTDIRLVDDYIARRQRDEDAGGKGDVPLPQYCKD